MVRLQVLLILRRYSSNKANFQNALETFKDRKFVPIRLKRFSLGDCFSGASIDFTKHFVDRKGNAIDGSSDLLRKQVFKPSIRFSSLFSKGFENLRLFSSGQELDNVNDQLEFAIHSFMYGFWSKLGLHEKCLESILLEEKANKIALLLACHLFSKMTNAMGKHYLVNKHISQFELCPCKKNCGEEIEYGDTGIGSEYLWYGHPDITLSPPGGSGVCVVLPKQSCEDNYLPLSIEDLQRQVIETKITSQDLRRRFNIRQFIAQNLTSSLCQKKYPTENPDLLNSNVSLIPTIAVSAESFDIYFYDVNNDILLRNDGDPIPLWIKENGRNRLDLSSVLMLWMVINYPSFKPKIMQAGIEKMGGSCNFLSQISTDELRTIESTVRMKSHFRPFDDEVQQAIDLPV